LANLTTIFIITGEKILIDTETGKVKVEGNVEINIMAIEGEETN
jgi:lipopolysaccharide assembly outer membrane protein LptD (OstA)